MMGIVHQYLTALRFLLGMTLVVGFLYPVGIFIVGYTAFTHEAKGSFVTLNGHEIGSSLIGQNFPGDIWFHSRLSAAGKSGYDGLSSGATNAGPNEPSLVKSVASQREEVAKEESIQSSHVPPEAITTSGSGLDPDISPAYAYLQAARVANSRKVPLSAVNSLIQQMIRPRLLGFLGEPRVNVLLLNVAMNSLK